MIAGLSPRAARCRSRQLTDRCSSPSSNHFTQGTSPLSTLVNGLLQLSSVRATSPQNPCGSSIDRRYIRWYSAASPSRDRSANPRGGGKVRASRDTDWMTPDSLSAPEPLLLIGLAPVFEVERNSQA